MSLLAIPRKYITDPLTKQLQHSRWRLNILRLLLRLDNALRRWIAFFAFEDGWHVKHRLMKYHQFFLDHIKPTDTVLDVGCGTGVVAYDVAQKAKHVTGIDINPKYLAVAHTKFQRPNLTFLQGDATIYPFTGQFDVLMLSNVLEHIEDRIGLLKKLRPRAHRFLIRVPLIDRDWIPLLKQELNIEYRLDPTHMIEYTEQIFRSETQQAGLVIDSLAIRFGELYATLHPQNQTDQ